MEGTEKADKIVVPLGCVREKESEELSDKVGDYVSLRHNRFSATHPPIITVIL